MAKKKLTQEEEIRALTLIREAQDNIFVAVAGLRSYYDVTEDDNIFRIIHALEERHSDREDCLGSAFNLDDVARRLKGSH